MPEKNSTTSTEKLADFLSGALVPSSIKPWDPGQFNLSLHFGLGELEAVTTAVTSTQGGRSEVTFIAPDVTIATSSAQELARWALVQKFPLAKLICHKIVDHISAQGMPELCEAMTEIYDFDRKRSEYQQKTLPSRQTVQANLGKSYQRPEFHIAEE